MISRLDNGRCRRVLYLTPDRWWASWRQPFMVALSEHFDITQIHYRLGHLPDMATEVMRSGERWDAVLVDTNMHGVGVDELAALKCMWHVPLVQYWVDQRDTLMDEIKARAPIIDLLVWTNDDARHAAMARTAGVREVRFIHAPSDDGIFFPAAAEKKWSICFLGNNVKDLNWEGRERRAAVESIAQKYKGVRVVGEGWNYIDETAECGPLDFWDSAQVVRESSVALSISHYHDIDGYTSDRLLNMIFSGTPTVYHQFAGSSKLVRNCWAVPYDGTIFDLMGKISEIMQNYQEYNNRASIASHEARAIYGRRGWAVRMAHYIEEAIKCHAAR